jgi:hypothetical protein
LRNDEDARAPEAKMLPEIARCLCFVIGNRATTDPFMIVYE